MNLNYGNFSTINTMGDLKIIVGVASYSGKSFRLDFYACFLP